MASSSKTYDNKRKNSKNYGSTTANKQPAMTTKNNRSNINYITTRNNSGKSYATINSESNITNNSTVSIPLPSFENDQPKPIRTKTNITEFSMQSYSAEHYAQDNQMTTYDYINRLAKGELLFDKEMQHWRHVLAISEEDIQREADHLLASDTLMNVRNEGLDAFNVHTVEQRQRYWHSLPINDLIDLIPSPYM